ncbi:hypothetical protein V8E36_006234 [Tilletia maclaganii]
MPLHTSQLPASITQAPSPAFLIFWASGQPSWCPDCRDAEPAVHAVFGTGPNDGGPPGYMIYVGDRTTWKDPQNQYRLDYNVQSVPTILRWEDGRETGRLEDYECQDETKLRAFIERNLYRISPSALIPSSSRATSIRPPSSSFGPTQPREPPGMKAVLSSASLKSFNHALTCLGKFGDNLCMQATRTEDGSGMLRLSTINASSSAFAAFFFYVDFFEELTVRLREDYESTKSAQRTKIECQLHARALGSILKSRLNRGLERCEIHIIQPWSISDVGSTARPTAAAAHSQLSTGNGIEARLLLRLHCAHGVVKTHKLTYEPKKSLYPTANPYPGCQFVIGPRTASEWLEHFLSAKGGGGGAGAPGGTAGSGGAAGPAGEVSLHCGSDFCIVKNKEVDIAGRLENRLGDGRGTILRSIQTQVRIDLNEFVSYDVEQTIHLTFPLKEFKAAITLAESLGLSLEIRFGSNDQPLFILLSNAPQIPTASHPAASGDSMNPRPTFEIGQPSMRAEFVLATTQEPDPIEGDGVAAAGGAPAQAAPRTERAAKTPPDDAGAAAEAKRTRTQNDGETVHSRGEGVRASQQNGSQGRRESQPRSSNRSESLPPVEALFQPSRGEAAGAALGDETDGHAGPQVVDGPGMGPNEGEEALPANLLLGGSPSRRTQQEANLPSHNHFVLNPSQMSNRAVDDAVISRLRQEQERERNGDAMDSAYPPPTAPLPGSMDVLRASPALDLRDADEGEDERGTPWGATAALAADAGGQAQRWEENGSAGMASPGRAAHREIEDLQDAFFGDDFGPDDGLDELLDRPVGQAQTVNGHGQNGTGYAGQLEEEGQDDDSSDPPPTPSPPPGETDDDEDTLAEDEIERSRRRKKYRPVF